MKSKPLGILAGVSLAVASLTAVAVPASASTPASVPGARTATAPPVDEYAALRGSTRSAARRPDDARREDRDGARRRLPLPFNGAATPASCPGNMRLGIPALYLADSPVGVGNGSTGVTQWADTSALASTWDTSLARGYGQAYGAEQAGKGHNIALMPTVNILRLAAVGPRAGDLQRGPVPDRRRPRRRDPRCAEPARHRDREALRREQPGDAAQPHQRGRHASAPCTRSTTPPSRPAVPRTPASAR